MSALLDRYRNEDLAIALSNTGSKTESDRFHSVTANTARMRRAMEYLHSVCVTEEARDSFVRFQIQYASVQNMPELSRPITTSKPINLSKSLNAAPLVTASTLGMGPVKGNNNTPKSEGRKISLFNRMLGRREKRESHG
jgi:hypothetical protein